MKIYRRPDELHLTAYELATGKGKTFSLTPEELEAAYREQEHNYRLEDARNQLFEFVGLQMDDPFSEESKEIAEEFAKEHNGCDIYQLAFDPCFLEAAVAMAEDHFDCNIGENYVSQHAIQETLSTWFDAK